MSDTRQELATLISSLNLSKFRELIRSYLKEKYKNAEVFITDGPYDGGIDLEIIYNGKSLKRCIQTTVQKSYLDAKITEDLQKALKLVNDHQYERKLEFYCSIPIPQSRQEDLKTDAEVTYNIDLIIYDNNKISQLSDNYPVIRAMTFSLLDIKTGQNSTVIDEPTKILFDALSLGKKTGEIKKQFVYAYIISFLYTHPNSSFEDIRLGVSEQLPDLSDSKVYLDSLSALKGQGAIATDEHKKLFFLTHEKKREIAKTYDENTAQELLLKTAIQSVLIPYSIERHTDEVLNFLSNAYKINYKIDLEEVNGKTMSVDKEVKKIFNELKRFLNHKGLSDKEADEIAKQLFEACGDNIYLNKMGASNLFVNLYKSDKLEDYLNKKIQHYYFDTQVLLRLICYQYEEADYADIPYKAVRCLKETIETFGGNVTLSTSYDYLQEVAAHIQEALKLQRFFEVPIFSKIGSSTNVFYNFYKFLLKQDLIEEDWTIEEWFMDLLDMESLPDYNTPSFVPIIAGRLRDLYTRLNINVVYHGMYENFHVIKREYEIALAWKDKYRTNTAVENDLRTIFYMASSKDHLDVQLGLRMEPFLVTWDNMFYDLRYTILKPQFSTFKFKYWYIYPPAKLADRISVMNMKLNPKSIDYNIISLVESSYNSGTRGGTFIDILNNFFNKRDISDLKFARKLMELQNTLIKEEPDREVEHEKRSPLLDILLEIRKHYNDPTMKFNFYDVVHLFEENKYESTLYDTFQRSVGYYMRNNHQIDSELFETLDVLIDASFSPKSSD